jgi:protein-S-isoprenylcysteine O-methyltransferase Ste14
LRNPGTACSKIDRNVSRTILKGVVRGIIFIIILAPSLLLPAGRVDYWQGWLYMGVNLLLMAVNLILSLKNPHLVEERLKPGPGVKWWDRLYFALSTPLYFIAIIVAALDTGRFGWSPVMKAGWYVIFYLVHLAGQGLFLWAKSKNSFFSSVVRIQTDRAHEVCDAGPYSLVRHPGYSGGILFEVTTPLMLGSLWGCIPQVVAAVLLVVRTCLEDQTLQEELPGYREYAGKVRYRLLPWIW